MNKPARKSKLQTIVWLSERLVGVALGLLLLRSSFVHLGNSYQFLSTVYSYELTGIESGKWLALFLPYAQMIVAICLIARWWRGLIYLLSLSLFSLFVVAQSLVMQRGLEIPCGCFGFSDSQLIGWKTLSIALAALVGSLLGLLLTFVGRSGGSPSPRQENV